jgi:hypothetical protein
MSNLDDIGKGDGDTMEPDFGFQKGLLEADSFRDVYRDIIPQICQPKIAKMNEEAITKAEKKPEPVEILTPFLQTRPEPLLSFESDSLSEGIRKSIKMMGLKQPTPIQKHSRRIITSNSSRLDRLRYRGHRQDRIG